MADLRGLHDEYRATPIAYLGEDLFARLHAEVSAGLGEVQAADVRASCDASTGRLPLADAVVMTCAVRAVEYVAALGQSHAHALSRYLAARVRQKAIQRLRPLAADPLLSPELRKAVAAELDALSAPLPPRPQKNPQRKLRAALELAVADLLVTAGVRPKESVAYPLAAEVVNVVALGHAEEQERLTALQRQLYVTGWLMTAPGLPAAARNGPQHQQEQQKLATDRWVLSTHYRDNRDRPPSCDEVAQVAPSGCAWEALLSEHALSPTDKAASLKALNDQRSELEQSIKASQRRLHVRTSPGSIKVRLHKAKRAGSTKVRLHKAKK